MDPATCTVNEKNIPLWREIQPHRPAKIYRKRILLAKGLVIATLLYFLWLHYSAPGIVVFRNSQTVTHTEGKDGYTFDDFDTIIPSEKLEWHKCWRIYKCARLTVPMDYNRPLNASKDNPKVHLGLILVPGMHPGSEKASKSPLLINPGGPGGSGFQLALLAGRYIQQLFGAFDQDLIGFDPRGVMMTTPRADCYSFPPDNLTSSSPSPDDEDYVQGAYHRFLWAQSGREIGLINSSDVALQQLDTRMRSTAKLCQTKDELYGDDSILKYVSTPNVARDMLSIVDAWDKWTGTLDSEPTGSEPPVAVMEEEMHSSADENDPYSLDTKGKLVFWGLSYGTMLGATFASMFPHRVGRMILDGVVDADGYVGPLWTESLWDTNKNFDSFATYCHKAKKRCALYRDGDEVKDIANRWQAVEKKLQNRPLTWIDEESNMPTSFGLAHLRHVTFSFLYAPYLTFPLLASIVSNLHEGIIDEIIKLLAKNPPYFDSQPFCGAPLSRFLYPEGEATMAVMCGDKRHPLNESLPNLEFEFEKMSNMSYFSDVFMSLLLMCDGYGIKNKGLTMDWDDNPAHKPAPIKTSFPILFISNSADPVTPLHAGLKMAKKFVDAGLIEQKSEGHCSTSTPSTCTNDWIQGYLKAGIVPPHPVGDLDDGKWVTCNPEAHPFDDGLRVTSEKEATAETGTMHALKKVQEELNKMKHWGPQGLEWLPNVQELLAVYESQKRCSH